MAANTSKHRNGKHSAKKAAASFRKHSGDHFARTLNLRLLLTSCVVLAILAIGLFALRRHRQHELVSFLAERASHLAEEGELRKADFYLQKYLTLRPDDYQARIRLIDYAERLVDQGAGSGYLVRLLYETIGLPASGAENDRSRLRELLAEQLLVRGEYKAALLQIEQLEKEGSPDLTPGPTRVKALAKLGLVPSRGGILESTRQARFSEVLPLLEEASDNAPEDATLALAVAQIYREYPSLAEDWEELANNRVDRMVAERFGEPDALVTRYRYRKRYQISGAIDDLEAAHKLDRDHYEANILLGLEALQRMRDADAKHSGLAVEASDFFHAAIDSRPTASDAYYLLAQLQWNQGERGDSIELLRDAERAVVKGRLDIRILLADFLLSEGYLDEATELVASLQEELESLIASTPASGLALMSNRLRLLEARLSAGRGDISSALAHYSTIASSPEALTNEARGTGSAASAISRQAGQETAKLLAGLGRWDQVAQQLSQLADQLEAELTPARQRNGVDNRLLPAALSLESEHRAARIQAAEAYLRAGQYAPAIKQLENITEYAGAKEKSLPREALETRLLAELSVQIDSLPGNRSWEEFQFLINRARKELPDSERIALATIQYQLAQSQDDGHSHEEVRAEILRVTERFPASPSVWWVAAQAYLDLADKGNAEAAMERYLKLEPDKQLQVSRRVAFLVAAERGFEAREWIASQIADADEGLKPLLRRLEIQLIASGKEDGQALRRASKLAKTSSDKKTLVFAFELAIAKQDWRTAEDIEQRLAELSSITPDEVEFYRARRMLANHPQLSTSQREELHRIVSRIQAERPTWHRGAEIAARLAEARGDEREAIQLFERAVALGDRSTSTLERLTLHLFREGRYAQAQEVIDRLLAGGDVLSENTESLAISTAVKLQRLSDAKKLAIASVAAHSEEPARRLWLYHVLVQSGDAEEAEITLNEARGDFPDSVIVWKAYFAHLVRNNRRDEALVLLEKLPQTIERDPYARAMTLASGYEMLGEFTRSRSYYQEAVEDRPKEAGARVQYANLLLRTDAVAAREQFEEVLRLQPDNVEARRRLAALLAASGEPSDWERIDELLAVAQDTGDQLDRRLRAILLTRRGKSVEERAEHCELARRILLGIVEDSSYAAQDIDRLLLAGAYEQEGILKADPTSFELARSQLSYLISKTSATNTYEELYINFLLRSIDALASMDDAASVESGFILHARRQLESQDRRLAASSDTGRSLERLTLLGLKARLLKAEDRVDEATEALQQFASHQIEPEQDQVTRARLILGLGATYSAIGAHAEAEPWYRELMKSVPGAELLVSQSLIQQGKAADGISLFLKDRDSSLSTKQAATLASLLSAAEVDPYTLEKAWPAVSGSLDKNSDDLELLLSVAVLQVTRGNQEEAIRLFRRVLAINPDHTLALNNLATLLGEREANREEALRLIRHAMRVAGRNPALLDTQGTIQLLGGDTEDAISSLEESVASVNVDPRYYFHLSAAYWKGGRSDKALDALEEARRRGLDRTVLTTVDRELMQELEAGLGVARDTLKKSA